MEIDIYGILKKWILKDTGLVPIKMGQLTKPKFMQGNMDVTVTFNYISKFCLKWISLVDNRKTTPRKV